MWRSPIPKLEIERTPFYLNTETRPWIHGSPQLPRRAGVNSFGFGGVNTHAVLEEYFPEAADSELYHRTWDTELILMEGATRRELINRCETTLEFLTHLTDADLVDIAYTLNRRLKGKPYRLAIVAGSPEDLTKKLSHAVKQLQDDRRSRIKERSGIYFFENSLGRTGKLAFLFPGEGSQYVNMLQDLCQHFPEVRGCFDLLDRAYIDHPRNYLPSQVIFPPTVQAASEAESRLWQIDGAVDAVITADRALFRLLNLLKIAPQGIVGHSSGELMALEAAGAVTLNSDAELVQLIRAGNQMLEALMTARDIPDGVLLAVGGVDRQAIDAAIETASEFLVLAMDNCPHQFVLCGSETAIAEARARFLGQGGICQTLPFKRAYHTKRFEPVLEPLRDYFQQATVTSPTIPLYSCMTAGLFPPEPEAIRACAVQQWARPVRFRETIEALYAEGFRIFLEVGPRSNLVSFVNDILKGREFLAVATNVHHRSGITQLNHALAQLAAHGVAMELDILYKHRAPRRLDHRANSAAMGAGRPSPGVILSRELPLLTLGKAEAPADRVKAGPQPEAPPDAPKTRHPEGREADFPIPGCPGAALPEKPLALTGTGQRPEESFFPAADTATMVSRPEAQAVMQEYLSTMQGFLETQEQVMLAYFQGVAHGAMRPAEAIRQPEPEPQLQAGGGPGAVSPSAGESTGPPPHSAAAPGEACSTGEGLTSRLLAIISDKTGYPPDMLNEHQNLEADLGIDSIKRLEILGVLFQQLGSTTVPTENLGSYRTVAEIVEFLSKPSDTESPDPEERLTSWPPETGGGHYIAVTPELPPVLRPGGRLTHLVPHQEVRVERRLDIETDLFLRHHTLGGQVSQTHPDLLALPVVPLSMSLEMMAAAAALLTPGHQLVGMKNIQVHDWLALTEGRLDLEIHAQVQADSAMVVAVQLRLLEADAGRGEPPRLAVEGTMLFGKEYAAAPGAGAFQPGAELPSIPAPEEFYPLALFHGPLFRVVKEIKRAGKNGMDAVLEMPPTRDFFRNQTANRFLTNPVLMDGAGQVVGLWAMASLESTFVIFPARIDEIIWYTPLGGFTASVLCRVSPRLEGNSHLASDIQLVAPDGSLLAQIQGMHHNRARVPKILHLFRGSREIRLSRPWPAPLEHLAASGKVVCNRLDPLPVELRGSDGRIWLNVMAHIGLSPGERQTWAQLTGPDKRRIEWLLARLTGKEAVRRLVQECYGFDVWLADIEIYPDPQGKPLVRGAWLNRIGSTPALSLTHSHGIAVALAADGAAGIRVGIDIELVHRPGKGFPDLAFASEEQRLLPPPESPEFTEWCLRFWCAKEAVAKALGRGLVNVLRDLQVVAINQQHGTVSVAVVNNLTHDYPGLVGKPVPVSTVRAEELVVASTVIREVPGNPEAAQGADRQDLKHIMHS